MQKSKVFIISLIVLSACQRNNSRFGLTDFKLPAAPASAQRLSGAAFVQKIEDLTMDQRELETELQVSQGNFPDFLRQFVPVMIDGKDSHQNPHRILIFVMPDYLSVGTNADFVRIPMRPSTAQRIADTLAMMLPTPKIVDEIYKSSQVAIEPVSMPPSSSMTSVKYFQYHNSIIEQELSSARRGMLVTGAKKDIVLTSRLANNPDKVAIYGWHRVNGSPVQKLNLEHASTYADYSHGVRMISRHAILDGVEVDLADVMNDSVLCSLLSYDGAVAINAYDRNSRIGLAH